MRYLVSIEPEDTKINDIDRSGAVMPFLAFLRETFEAEAFYLEAGQRKIWMVVEFATAADLNKLTCLSVYRLGAYPTFRALFTEEENDTAIPASLAFMEQTLRG